MSAKLLVALVVLVLGLCVVGRSADAGSGPAKDSDEIQGTWLPSAAELAGKKFADEVRTYGNATTGALADKDSGFDVVIGGIVSALRVTRTKKGDAMAIVQLEDWEGIVEVLLFPDTYSRAQRLLEADAAIFVKGKLDNDETATKILASDVYPMERAREILSRSVVIRVDPSTVPQDLPDQLQPIIDLKKGPAELVFALNYPGRYTVYVRPNPYVKVLPDREFVDAVERINGSGTVTLQ